MVVNSPMMTTTTITITSIPTILRIVIKTIVWKGRPSCRVLFETIITGVMMIMMVDSN